MVQHIIRLARELSHMFDKQKTNRLWKTIFKGVQAQRQMSMKAQAEMTKYFPIFLLCCLHPIG